MKINEIFLSIQGESTHVGRLCLFIRTTGCNLRCTYCDTEYAFYGGKEMTIPELIDIVRKSGVNLIEITGGEPLMQDDLPELVDMLLSENYEVLVETGGSIDIGTISANAIKILDLKCPSSGMMDKNIYDNINKLGAKDEVKFVIGTKEDFDWAVEIIEKYRLDTKVTVLFSPVFDELKPVQLAEWILKDKPNVRMQLQLHKYIWEPDTQGV
ncbi:radical SAM protein [candidate division KSB1 bacterium]|nr:radical SAM protein [candidate division KSB1 bacterium]